MGHRNKSDEKVGPVSGPSPCNSAGSFVPLDSSKSVKCSIGRYTVWVNNKLTKGQIIGSARLHSESSGLLNFYREDKDWAPWLGGGGQGKEKRPRPRWTNWETDKNGKWNGGKKGDFTERRRLAIRRSDKLNQLTHLPTRTSARLLMIFKSSQSQLSSPCALIAPLYRRNDTTTLRITDIPPV